MPSFPHTGSVTVCEINRNFITAESLSEERARDSYGKILGVVFSAVCFQSDGFVLANHDPDTEHAGNTANIAVDKGLRDALQAIFSNNLKWLFHPNNVELLHDVDLQGVSWHRHKHLLAFISGPNQVMVRDYEDSEQNDPFILMNDSQQEVNLVEWRPNGGKTLAVACRGGICIWAASCSGSAASVRSGRTSYAALSRSYGIKWTLVDFLQSSHIEQISAMSWSPDGRHLASGSHQSSAFTIWDVAQGLATPVRRGLAGISMLKWSPTGDYLFSAQFDGTFYLWETNTWTSEPWSSAGGFVTGAAWDPDGKMIMIAFSKSPTLASIHFASKPPSLDVHLLSVDLLEIGSLIGSQGIEKMAWDGSGERLALSYKGGNALYCGLVAIYDVRRKPIISASLIGFIRGPGENPKPLYLSFHNKFKQGPLLTVCWSSGFCCTYPLIFRSHTIS